ncbi:MAG: hypothetical protein E7046_04545 [Lentisphaerae bacterium]|nr:hypothetical protein [Lentisphaerota bacterium]
MKLDEIKNLIENGDIVKADAELKAIVEREPDNTQAKLLYGTCRLLLGDEDVFRKIHEEVELRMAFEKDRDTISVWKKYSRLWEWLVVGALVIGGAVVYFGWDAKIQMDHQKSITMLYAGPRYIEKGKYETDVSERKSFVGLADTERRKPVKSVRPVAVRLKEAVNRADVEAVRKLIEQNETELKKADVTFDDIFRRFDGSSRQMEIVRLLDEKGFKLPFRDVELAKVFYRKSITDSTVTNAVGYLIDKGADVNEVDFFGNTLLANLCDDNHHKKDLVYVVRFLLEKGADPNLGKKPPLLALTASHRYSPYAKETIKLLLEKGANVNVEDSFFNRTPLENAVKGICDIELVKLLVEHGATITDEIIKRARRRPEVQKYLLEKSGKTEADIYPQRKSKVKFDSSSEKKFDGKVRGAP